MIPLSQSRFRVVFLQYFGFFAIGIVLSLIGPLIPLIRADVRLSYGAVGLIFPAQSAGSLAVLLLSSFLIHILEKRKLLIGGSLAFAAGLVLCSLAPDFAALAVGNVLIGMGVATIEIGMNTLCIDSHPEGKGKALNRLHFFFGAGAVIGPLIAFSLRMSGASAGAWRWAFGIAAALPLVVFVILVFTRLPASPKAEPAVRFGVYRRPLLWFSALALCLYCGVEWGVGGWFPSYWQNLPLSRAVPSEIVTSLFWLTFAAGRFTTQFLADRWGFRLMITVAMSFTLAAVVLWLAVSAPLFDFIIVLALGFIIACLYPTLVALGSHKFPSSSGQAAGFLSVFGVIGGAVFPAAVGFWADIWGIGALAGAEVILVSGMIVFILLAFAADKRQEKV